MSTPNDGGPAFPVVRMPLDPETVLNRQGMSLRDYFAAHASEEDILEHVPQTYGECKDFKELNGFWPTRQWARYVHADRMLKAMGLKARGQ